MIVGTGADKVVDVGCKPAANYFIGMAIMGRQDGGSCLRKSCG